VLVPVITHEEMLGVILVLLKFAIWLNWLWNFYFIHRYINMFGMLRRIWCPVRW
jgi:hypothetical protein